MQSPIRLPDIEDHQPQVYTTDRNAWVVCECEWQSNLCHDQMGAQWEWMGHIASLVKPPKPPRHLP